MVVADERSWWTYRDFPAQLPDLQLDLSVLVEAAAADPTTGTVVDLSYGQGDVTSGTQSCALLPLAPSPNDPRSWVASGNVTLPRTTLPDDVSSLWLEATTSGSSSLGTRGDSVRFTPLALHRLPAQTAGSGRPPCRGPRPKDSGVVVGDFSSDGDPISGRYWLRDPCTRRRERGRSRGCPSGKAHLRLELEVLVPTGPAGVRSRRPVLRRLRARGGLGRRPQDGNARAPQDQAVDQHHEPAHVRGNERGQQPTRHPDQHLAP